MIVQYNREKGKPQMEGQVGPDKHRQEGRGSIARETRADYAGCRVRKISSICYSKEPNEITVAISSRGFSQLESITLLNIHWTSALLCPWQGLFNLDTTLVTKISNYLLVNGIAVEFLLWLPSAVLLHRTNCIQCYARPMGIFSVQDL